MEHALVCFFFEEYAPLLEKYIFQTSLNINSSDFFFFKSKKKKNPEKQEIMQLTAIGQCALTFNSESMMN